MTLLEPFPAENLPLVWGWLQEFPELSIDDYGPQSLTDFTAAMEERLRVERIWQVSEDGQPCGIIAYLPITERLGTFHGICFTSAVHGRGIAKRAVRQVLDELFASGCQKISAGFFASNVRVHRFLASLGAVDEGLLRKQTMRGGVAIDLQLIAFFKD